MSDLSLTVNDQPVEADAAVTFNVTSNPKREGSKAHARFAKYIGSETVQAYLDSDGTKGDLRYDWDKGFIDIDGVDRDDS